MKFPFATILYSIFHYIYRKHVVNSYLGDKDVAMHELIKLNHNVITIHPEGMTCMSVPSLMANHQIVAKSKEQHGSPTFYKVILILLPRHF